MDTELIAPERRFSCGDRWQRNVRVAFRAVMGGGELAAARDGTSDEARRGPLAGVIDLPRAGLADVPLGMRA